MALAVTVKGTRDILGLWAGEHGDGEGAKFWLRVLTEIKNRGVADVCLVVCDGLKGLPEAIAAVWPQAITQTCVVHLLRASFRYASKRDWSALAKDLKPVYTAASEQAALDAFAEFAATWEARYPAIIRLWENAWAEFVPFLRFDTEIRSVVCTTNAIESINARIRRAVNARGHFPTEQAALKCVYLALMSLDPTGQRTETLVQPVEGRVERLRDHLRRPAGRRPEIKPPPTTMIVPSSPIRMAHRSSPSRSFLLARKKPRAAGAPPGQLPRGRPNRQRRGRNRTARKSEERTQQNQLHRILDRARIGRTSPSTRKRRSPAVAQTRPPPGHRARTTPACRAEGGARWTHPRVPPSGLKHRSTHRDQRF